MCDLIWNAHLLVEESNKMQLQGCDIQLEYSLTEQWLDDSQRHPLPHLC